MDIYKNLMDFELRLRYKPKKIKNSAHFFKFKADKT